MIDLLEPCFLTPNDYNLRRDSQNYTIPRCRTVSYYKSFIPSVVKLWNELDTNAKNALSINQFKSVLDKIYKPEIPPKYFCSEKPFNSTCSQNGECQIAFRCIQNKCKCLQTEVWDGIQCNQRNDNIHLLSSNGYHELSIYMETPNKEHQWGNYSLFYIADEMNKYVLTVAGFEGKTDDDAFIGTDPGKANAQAFTTRDRDNDKSRSSNCAFGGNSGWWYNACEDSDLNKIYNGPTGDMYWDGFGTDISKSLMMIRRT
ncbi:unnamed protein product [Mytilus edulis]|uniref:Fibrinogen C-terminal domain-containing protein n=1 Tax=Mytilus edulis TaxID=6550 RepID=A0A8S3U6F7_MYTED|nr:unnamed protein product [Mytilus edulis]